MELWKQMIVGAALVVGAAGTEATAAGGTRGADARARVVRGAEAAGAEA